jgi:hypothetical protein
MAEIEREREVPDIDDALQAIALALTVLAEGIATLHSVLSTTPAPHRPVRASSGTRLRRVKDLPAPEETGSGSEASSSIRP